MLKGIKKHSGDMPFLCLKQDYAKGKHGVVSNEKNIKDLFASYVPLRSSDF